jgi:hypothetical protein
MGLDRVIVLCCTSEGRLSSSVVLAVALKVSTRSSAQSFPDQFALECNLRIIQNFDVDRHPAPRTKVAVASAILSDLDAKVTRVKYLSAHGDEEPVSTIIGLEVEVHHAVAPFAFQHFSTLFCSNDVQRLVCPCPGVQARRDVLPGLA